MWKNDWNRSLVPCLVVFLSCMIIYSANGADVTSPRFGLNIGDEFKYNTDEGFRSVKVTGFEGDIVKFINNEGLHYHATPGLFFGGASWHEATSEVTYGDPMELWPLKVGNKVTIYKKSYYPKRGRSFEFKIACEVVDKVKISVEAGDFDTFKVFCGFGRNNRRTYFYAPEIGYFVKRIFFYGRTNKTVNFELSDYVKMGKK